MKGFLWSANSPYIRGMWVRVRRAPRAPGLSTNIADGFIDTGRFRNANPAYIIYECLTNGVWGMGGSPDEIDSPSFQYVAQLMRNERFGLFMLWVQSDTIENFVNEVLDHIQVMLFLHPRTGLLTLKALRGDYDVPTLGRLNPDNAEMQEWQRKTWGQTVNEIVVTWTNPETEQPETVTVQDLANIVQQGGQVVSQSRNYYGIREAAVAAMVAERDLRAACAPLSTGTLRVLRSEWDAVPGDLRILDWPEEDVEDLVVRINSVDYGAPGQDQDYVTISVIEDIFALDAPTITQPPGTAWVPTERDPSPVTQVKLITAPAFLIANAAGLFVEQPENPEVMTAILAADPNIDFLNMEPYTATTLATGDVVQQSIGTRERVGYATLPAAIAAEVLTTFTTFANMNGPSPRLADLVFIGDEIALLQSIGTDGTITLYRGVLDTVPQAWPAGTPMWFLGSQTVIDVAARAPGETVSYRLLMRTSVTLLPFASAPVETVTLTARPYLPFRPANVKVNGQAFGVVALAGAAANVQWATRNRLLETSQILAWDTDSVPPESGQTTTIEVLSSSGSVLKTFAGLTSTSLTITALDLAGGSVIRLYAVAGGSRSFQSFDVRYTA